MVRLAKVLVDSRVTPIGVGGDALHVAMAVCAGMDYMATWKVKHLANPNKVNHVERVCASEGWRVPKIVRPDTLLEIEDDQV